VIIEWLIDQASYELSISGLAGNVPEPVRMQNCAETLLGQGQITELKLEYAIQVAEDWLMPLATVAKGFNSLNSICAKLC